MNLNLIVNVITKPNSFFEEITQNFSSQYKMAMTIFWVAGLIIIFPNLVEMNHWQIDPSTSEENILAIQSISMIIEVTTTIIQNFVLIYAIFWVGKRVEGGNSNYRKAFTVLSFCLIPTIIGIIVSGIITAAFMPNYLFMQEGGETVIDGPFEQNPQPSYLVDFFSAGIIPNSIAVFFGGGTLILFVKATRILNGFSLKDAIITVAVAMGIFFFLHVVFGVVLGVFVALSRFFF